ncbi:hypothetical protein SAMN04488034_101183 [Salinimicrobium catena]|uniref:Lipocalin-like domain-containing protein n=1 Tax=Salinimicrobium catena TaxID=390640 RepID=A0A1H5HK29_9FLAO|nr:hypothetical protein [Salinimicrobium catena]SDK70798.1 hypothetical protein SAMN04488140_101183 [Salinimicrobium catena]SEE28386.1 hypothetical protein SAMN04488034_101183 [Salinimicrobium catena]
MKTKLFTKLFTLLVVCVSFTGCMTDEEVEDTLNGQWEEVYPQSFRTTLIFSSDKKMTRIDENENVEVYDFRIDGDEIFLSLEGSEDETALSFDKLDPGRFNIGYLYPSIPESDPDKFMTFEKLPQP